MKDKKETIINVFNQLKEIWKNPRGRSIIMLVLYFFFFLFIIIGLRNGHKVDNTEKKDTTSDLDYSIEKIKNSNYHYKYLVDYYELKDDLDYEDFLDCNKKIVKMKNIND